MSEQDTSDNCPFHRPDKYIGRVIVCRVEEVNQPRISPQAKRAELEMRPKGCTGRRGEQGAVVPAQQTSDPAQ
ncbi:MAG TPA: hypothetical protein VEF04_04765 [Blastocatellia bacterium]|nr:hypothetical protein [Blastocatellia bacterium]